MAFQVNVATSLTDSYTLTAQAPPGWTVSIDNNGNVTVTPAPGSKAGPIRSRCCTVAVRPKSRRELL